MTFTLAPHGWNGTGSSLPDVHLKVLKIVLAIADGEIWMQRERNRKHTPVYAALLDLEKAQVLEPMADTPPSSLRWRVPHEARQQIIDALL